MYKNIFIQKQTNCRVKLRQTRKEKIRMKTFIGKI